MRAGAPAELVAVEAKGRYRGPGVPEGFVKTTLTLRFGSPLRLSRARGRERVARRGGPAPSGASGAAVDGVPAATEEDDVKETKGRSEGKAESAGEATLEGVLDAIESRLESLVEVVKGLSRENARLESELASAREASEKNGGAAAALARHEAERTAVRARIERLLKTLEETNVPGRRA